MSVTFKNAGAPVAIASNAASPAPNATNPVAADRSYMIVTVKPDTTTVNTPTNWTHVATHTGGTGAQNTDTGQSKVAVFRRDGAFSGGQSMTTSGFNSGSAVIITFQKTLGAWVAEATATGADSTTGSADFSAGTGSNPGWTAGDAMFVPISLPTDASTLTQGGTITNAAVNATGISGGTTNSIYWESATGQDSGGGVIIRHGVTGTASSNPDVFGTFTAAANVVGPCIFIRVRDETTTENVDLVAATMTFTPQALDPVSGVVNVDLVNATLTFQPQALDPAAPPLEVDLAPAVLTFTPQALDPVSQVVNVNLAASTLTFSPQALDPVSGVVNLDLAPALLTFLPQPLDAVSGVVNLDLVPVTLVFGPQALDPEELGAGVQNVDLVPAILTFEPQALFPVEIGPITYRFSPPAVLEQPVGYENKVVLLGLKSQGRSLRLQDGLFVVTDLLVYERDVQGKLNGVHYFIGGHNYSGLPQVVADLLIASGFTPEAE